MANNPLKMKNRTIKNSNTFLGGYFPDNNTNVGAPTTTPIAYNAIKWAAVGMSMFKSFAISGKIPIIENSVIPIARPPKANAIIPLFIFFAQIVTSASLMIEKAI
ncbi:hypothetical protein D3C86_1351380 [compost metagenome]